MMIMEALRDNRADTNDKTMVAPEAIRAVVVVSDLDHKVGIVDLHHRPSFASQGSHLHCSNS